MSDRSDRSSTARRRSRRRRALAATSATAVTVAAIAAAVAAGGTGPAKADTFYGPYFFSRDGGNICLDDRGSSTQDGNPVQDYTCNSTDAQNWYYDFSDGTVRLASNTKECLDVKYSGTSPGTPVDLWTCDGTLAQQWAWVKNTLVSALTTNQLGTAFPLCLGNRDGSFTPGTQEQVSLCNGSGSQLWPNHFIGD